MERKHITDGTPCWCDPIIEDYSDGTARVHAARKRLLKNPKAKAAHDAQKARIDARVAQRRADHSDGTPRP